MLTSGLRGGGSIFGLLIFSLVVFTGTPATVPPYLFAQSPPRFRMIGRVTDKATGEAITGASVAVTGAGLNTGAVTDQDGRYAVSNLPAEQVEVRCRSVGYRDVKNSLVLIADTVQNFSLSVEAVKADEISVTAQSESSLRQSPQSVSVMTEKDLDLHRGQTLGETMAQLPGITVLQTGPSVSKPVIRGLHSQRVVILNAGVRQEGQQWGAEHAPELDPFVAARIEVVKGASSVEYGADAIGGVIRIEPRELPHAAGLDGRVSMNVFSNNRQGALSVFVEGGLPWLDGFGWRVQGSVRKAGDAASPDYGLLNTAFSELDGSISLGYQKAWGDLMLYLSYFSTELGIFKGSHVKTVNDLIAAFESESPFIQGDFSYSIGFPKQVIQHTLFSLRSRVHLGDAGDLIIEGGAQQNSRQEFDAYKGFQSVQPGERPAFDLILESYSGSVKFQHRPWHGFLGTAGVSVMQQQNANFGGAAPTLIPNFSSTTTGLYFKEEWIQSPLTLNIGARFDYRSLGAEPYASFLFPYPTASEQKNFQAITGAAGAIAALSASWTLSASAASAWRAPSVNELYSYGVHHGTAQFEIGNRNLAAERSLGLDLTLRGKNEKVQTEISLFTNSINGFIYLFPRETPFVSTRGTFPVFEYRQTDARLTGLDGSVEVEALAWLRLTAGLSLVRGVNLSEQDALIGMPADRLRLGAHFHLPAFAGVHDPFAEVNSTLVRVQDQLPRIITPAALPPNLEGVVNLDELGRFYSLLLGSPAGYGIVDVSVGGELNLFSLPLQLTLSVQNLFDQRYRDYLSRFRFFANDPGRSVALRVQLPFGIAPPH
ncbi:MAG: TonB-dependent receptor [Rhizobacter sp.]|nr:TonB-dependent receptor [Chlorobiales bacterium]